MTTVVLASASPSRLHILRAAGIEPLVVVSQVDEEALYASLPPGMELVQHLSAHKARHVAQLLPTTHPDIADDSLIIGCDSLLLTANGELLGKPLTVERTIDYWHQLRGTQASLLTGHTVVRRHGNQVTEAGAVQTTTVHFGTPTDADIERYARTGEPLNCAGAFTLEARGGWFIDGIDGDPSNVIGLSLTTVRQCAAQLGVSITELWKTE